MSVVPGTHVGPYEVLASIGAGGMGEVYRARDTQLKRDVALKILPASLALDPDHLARFDREAQALAALNHPHVAQVYGFAREGDVRAIALELVEGPTLAERIARGALPTDEALRIAIQLAEAIEYAHEHGIVHRDLKPANVKLTADGAVKVLDFGLAKVLADEAPASGPDLLGNSPTITCPAMSRAGMILGTAAYMAPEQARGVAVDKRADIWAFGVILFEMLTGGTCFTGETVTDVLAAVVRSEPDWSLLPKGTPPRLRELVQRCLAKDRRQRFRDIGDTRLDLERIVATPVEMPEGAPASRRPFTRVMVLATSVAVVLALALLAGIRIGSLGSVSSVRFKPLTFERGTVRSARFSPDGNTIVYGAAWRGEPIRMFVSRDDGASTPLNLPAGDVLSISDSGELAVSLGRTFRQWLADGTLARVPLLGSSPRPLEEHVREADWIPGTGELAIVRRVAGRDRLEFPTNNVVYDTSGYISHPRVSADGTRLAFLDHPLYGDNRGFVSVVDRARHRQRLTPEYVAIEGLAWSPSGDEIWFSAPPPGGSSWAIHAVSVAGGSVRAVQQAPVNLHLLDVRKDGRALIMASNVSGTIQGRGPADAFERNLVWGAWSSGRVLSTDRRWLAETNFDKVDYDIYLCPMDGTDAIPVGHGEAQDISPDDKWLLAITPTQPRKLLLVPIGPGEARTVELPGVSPLVSRFLPGGTRALVAGVRSDGGTELVIVGLADGVRERVPQPGAIEILASLRQNLQVSPDGRELAFAEPGGEVLAIPLGGGAVRTLLRLDEDESFVNWATDAGHVFVVRWQGTRGYVFRVAVQGGRREMVHEISVADMAGALDTPSLLISRSGDAYVYSFTRLLGNLYLAQGLR